MSRRELLLYLTLSAQKRALASSLGLNDKGGTALLFNLSTGRLQWYEGVERARRWLMPPGSTMKPMSLLALLESGRLKPEEEFVCPRQLNCSHPPTPWPMNAGRAIAYSCNCATAHFAQRFEPGELPAFLRRLGLGSATGWLGREESAGQVSNEATATGTQLQALGEAGVRVTPVALLGAYRRLAGKVGQREFAPVLEGMEAAVEFGTAQLARIDGRKVAGKTGSVQTADGGRAAWFAGFAPSRAPEAVVTVLLQGKSGGADAAPVAGRILRAHFAGEL
jgi:penicillin-binding protein 2